MGLGLGCSRRGRSGENRSVVDHGAPEGRISLRSQAAGLAKRPYVTSVAAPEAATAATFGVFGKTLTQEASGIQDIYEVRKLQTRAKLDQELDYSTGS